MDQLSPFKCFRNTRKRPEWCASHNKEYLMEEAFDITARKKKKSHRKIVDQEPVSLPMRHLRTLSEEGLCVSPGMCRTFSSQHLHFCLWLAIKFHLQSSMLEKQVSSKVTRNEMSRKQQAAEKSLPLSERFQWKHLTHAN